MLTTKQAILLFSCLLLLPQPSSTQYYRYDEPITTAGSVFTDPIRRALGLWGRLLNRMAQTSPPTDDQLHLTEAVEEVPLNPARTQQATFSNLGKSGAAANSIIDEQKLLELLPRVRSPSTTTTITSSTSTTTTPTTSPITLRISSSPSTAPKKSKKRGKNKVISPKISTQTPTTTSAPTSKPIPLPLSDREKLAPGIVNKTLTVHMRTLDSMFSENTTFEDVLIKNSNISLDKAVEKETEELISEIESVLSDEQWIVPSRWNNNSILTPTTTTTIATTSPLEATPQEDHLQEEGSGESSEEGPSEESEESSEEGQSEESEESSEEEEDNEIPSRVQSAESNDLKATSTVATTTTTTHQPSATTPTKGTTTNFSSKISSNSSTTTVKPKKLRSPSKKKEPGNGFSNANIAEEALAYTNLQSQSPKKHLKSKTSSLSTTPATTRQRGANPSRLPQSIPEAEEEEVAGNLTAQLQLDSSTALPSGQNVFNVNSNANSNSNPQLASVITPVNSIIDGIGPLILPLIGYSRQAISQYYPRRVEGTPIYRPETQEAIQSSQFVAPAHSPGPAPQQQQPLYSPSTPYRRKYGQPSTPQLPQYPPLPSRAVSQQTAALSDAEAKHISEMMQRQLQQNRNFKHFSEMSRLAGGVTTPNLSNRIVNAETVVNGAGPRSRFMPNPSVSAAASSNLVQQMQQQTPMPTIFASDAIRRALANILHRAGETPIVKQISGSNVQPETPYYPPQIPLPQRYGNNVIRESFKGFQSTATAVSPDKLAAAPSSSIKPPIVKSKANGDDPGYDKGRSEVESTFYSDSGIMVQEASNKDKVPPPEQIGNSGKSSVSIPQSSSLRQSSGFGGGRRPPPDIPF